MSEIYGKIVDVNNRPIAGATIQRLYPEGQNYSSPVISAADGTFNGRVPDRTYSWAISAPGFYPLIVPLEGVPINDSSQVVVVALQPVGVADNEIENGSPGVPLWVWVAAGAAAVYVFRSKIF